MAADGGRDRSLRVSTKPAPTTPADPPRFDRHVFYIPGYAPDGPERHHALISREAARFARVWGVAVDVSAIDATSTSWTLESRMPDGAVVATTFEVLAWEDFVRADFRTPMPSKLREGAATLVDSIRSGLLKRICRAAPWFGFCYLYPYLWLLGCLLVSVAIGAVLVTVFTTLAGDVFALLIAAAVAVLLVKALQKSGLFAIHLLDDWNAQARYRRRSDAAFERRLDDFAARISEIDRAGVADEILVVGHSSGSFLAIDVVARAFDRDSALGARRAALSLLTVGVAELLVALHPGAGWLRERIARLANERRLFWAEVVGRFDALNFPHRSPLAEFGMDETSPNPHFVRVKLNDMLDRAKVLSMMRRLDAFRIHFQFVMANDRRAPYDFFSLLCGARTAAGQFGRTHGDTMAPWA